jgi:hypothetical protein
MEAIFSVSVFPNRRSVIFVTEVCDFSKYRPVKHKLFCVVRLFVSQFFLTYLSLKYAVF